MAPVAKRLRIASTGSTSSSGTGSGASRELEEAAQGRVVPVLVVDRAV